MSFDTGIRCYDDHICAACGSVCKCGTYTWACPWQAKFSPDVICGYCRSEEEERWNEYFDDTKGAV